MGYRRNLTSQEQRSELPPMAAAQRRQPTIKLTFMAPIDENAFLPGKVGKVASQMRTKLFLPQHGCVTAAPAHGDVVLHGTAQLARYPSRQAGIPSANPSISYGLPRHDCGTAAAIHDLSSVLIESGLGNTIPQDKHCEKYCFIASHIHIYNVFCIARCY